MKFEELLKENRPLINSNIPSFNSLELTDLEPRARKEIKVWNFPATRFTFALSVALVALSISLLQIVSPISENPKTPSSTWFPGALKPAVGAVNLLSVDPNASNLVVEEQEWLYYEINSTDYPRPARYWHSGADELVETDPWGAGPASNTLSDWPIDSLGTTYFGPAWHKTLPVLQGNLNRRVQELYKELLRQANVAEQAGFESSSDTFYRGLDAIIKSELADANLRITAMELWNRLPDPETNEFSEYIPVSLGTENLFIRTVNSRNFTQIYVLDPGIPGKRQEFTLDCRGNRSSIEEIWVQSLAVVDEKFQTPAAGALERLERFSLDEVLAAMSLDSSSLTCD